MTQNIYDNPEFFAGYSGLPRSVGGLDKAPEWPGLKALLPPLRGRCVADLGCGFGWFCRWARAQGAANVLGVDVSENMLARAATFGTDEAIGYRLADLESLELPAASFDVVFSSLTLHYIVDLHGLLATVARALLPGGMFVASFEHPMLTAPSKQAWIDVEGRRVWALDSYLLEGPRETNWLAPGVIKQHRTLGSYLNLVVGSGMSLTHLQEWGPSDEQLAAQPSWIDERHRPSFVLMAAIKPA